MEIGIQDKVIFFWLIYNLVFFVIIIYLFEFTNSFSLCVVGKFLFTMNYLNNLILY
jgi:hypothetical protein